MSGTDPFTVGERLPRIQAASVHEGFQVTVTWAGDAPRVETVDLAPALFAYRAYRALRDDPGLFGSVHVADDGFALAWGDGGLDMTSTAVEALAARDDGGARLLAAQDAILREVAARFAGDESPDRVTDYLTGRNR